MAITNSNASPNLDDIIQHIRSRLEEAEIAAEIAQRLACRQYPKNLHELRFGPVRGERKAIVEEHLRNIDDEVQKFEDEIMEAFECYDRDDEQESLSWKEIAQAALLRERALIRKEKAAQTARERAECDVSVSNNYKTYLEIKVATLEERAKASEESARKWQQRAKDLEGSVRCLEDRVREAEASEKSARKAEQEARRREEEARKEGQLRDESARPHEEETAGRNSGHKSRGSDKPPDQAWRRCVDAAIKQSKMKLCPAPPRIYNCTKCCKVSKVEVFGSSPMCYHELEKLLRGSGSYHILLLRKERLLWHPDRFGQFCHPLWREEGKVEAQKLFQLFGRLVDEWHD